ncbi:hypothetical protein [Micromonospora sp. RTGN7]|uniref:RICIN domain-containing protein n=1 Tax=Micromonospora sp. RTGN7 TaxID=3016526 RepID=UPI0029FEF3E2|nr:hypothetical protein [Micromonospora sp. RTGN7]
MGVKNVKVGSLKRAIARLAVVVVAIGAPAMVTATPAQAQYVSVNAWGMIFNEYQWTKTLTWSISTPRFIYASDNILGSQPRQSWIVQDNAPNGHTIFHADGCLDSNAQGEPYVMGCNGGNYQRWHFNRVNTSGKAVWQIQNKATGLCLENWNNGGVWALPCANKSGQRWFMG